MKIHFIRISYGFRTDFIRIFEYQFNNYMWNNRSLREAFKKKRQKKVDICQLRSEQKTAQSQAQE